MAASTLVDLVKVTTSTVGAGSVLQLSAAVAGFRPAAGSLINGNTYSYAIQQGANWEYGRGAYTASTNRLARAVIKSSNSNTPINLLSGAQVAIVLLAEDLEDRVGIPAELTIGSVTSGPTPSVSISGVSPNFTLDFVLEPGPEGDITPALEQLRDDVQADATQTAADRMQTGQDRTATGADRTAVAADKAVTTSDRNATDADANATAADRDQTGQDRSAVAALAAQVAADRDQTGQDVLATGYDAIATAQDRVSTSADRLAADGDANATALDRIATGQDRAAAQQAVIDAQAVTRQVATALAAGTIGLLIGQRIYASKTAAQADLSASNGQYSLVVGDPIAVNNDLYVKVGASGTGSNDGPLGIFAAASALALQYAGDASGYANAAHADALSIATTKSILDNMGYLSGFSYKIGSARLQTQYDGAGELAVLSLDATYYGPTPNAGAALGLPTRTTVSYKIGPSEVVVAYDNAGGYCIVSQVGDATLPPIFGGSGVSGLPGGKPGQVAVKNRTADGASAWVWLSEAITTLTTGVPPQAMGAPADLGGATGNPVTFPQMCRLQGLNSNLVAVGSCQDSGAQVVYILDIADGVSTPTLLETHTVRALDPKDDHNPCTVVAYPDGSLTAAVCGHNTNQLMAISRRAADGTWTDETPINYGAPLSYAGLFLDKNDKLWMFVRENNFTWSVRTRDTWSGAWSTRYPFATWTSQLYAVTRYDSRNHRFSIFMRSNSQNPAYGQLRLALLDCATGLLTDGTGGLGYLNGTPYGGKTLPVDFTVVDVTFAKPTGRALGITDWYGDLSAILIDSRNTSLDTDTTVSVWSLTGTDPFDQSHYSVSSVIFNAGAVLSAISSYPPGWVLASEPHIGFRVYSSRFNGGQWRIEKWDNVTRDGVVWQNTQLASSATLFCRPMCIQNASEKMPISFCSFTGFVDYDNYTSAACKWVRPDLA